MAKEAFNTIHDKLFYIQQQLVAPKEKSSKDVRYKYRSAEFILEKVKPHLAATGCTLRLYDELIEVGSRIYIKSTVCLCDGGDQMLTSSALAREGERLAGMSDPQITGAVSSYARKYALCGLLAIDDNQDPDELPQQKQHPSTEASKAAAVMAEALQPAGKGKDDVYPYAGFVDAMKNTATPKPAPAATPSEPVDELPF